MSMPDRPLRTLEEVVEQLTDLRAAKQALGSLDSADFAAQASLASLLSHEQALLDEKTMVELALTGQTMEIVLDGDAVSGHTVEAGFLADILGRFQRLLDGVAEARAGNTTGRGQVAEQIRSTVRLMVSDFVPGSFGVRITMPEQAEQLFGEDVLSATLGLFASDPQVEVFLPLMRLTRVKANYEALLKSLVAHDGHMKVRTRSGGVIGFGAVTAQQRLDWIDLVETTSVTIDVMGELVGGDVEKKTYVLVVEDTHYRGKVLDIAIEELRKVTLGSTVSAKLIKVVKEQVDGIVTPTEQFYMESITVLGEPHQERIPE